MNPTQRRPGRAPRGSCGVSGDLMGGAPSVFRSAAPAIPSNDARGRAACGAAGGRDQLVTGAGKTAGQRGGVWASSPDVAARSARHLSGYRGAGHGYKHVAADPAESIEQFAQAAPVFVAAGARHEQLNRLEHSIGGQVLVWPTAGDLSSMAADSRDATVRAGHDVGVLDEPCVLEGPRGDVDVVNVQPGLRRNLVEADPAAHPAGVNTADGCLKHWEIATRPRGVNRCHEADPVRWLPTAATAGATG